MPGLFFSLATLFFAAFEYRAPSQLFPYTLAAVDYSVPGLYAVPSALPAGDGFTLSTYGCRPYSGESLHSYSSGTGYSSGRWGTQFRWTSFGTGFYSENSFTLGAGFAPVRYIRPGFSASAYLLRIDTGEERLNDTMYDADLSLAIVPFEWIEISFIQTNSSLLFSDKNSRALWHEWSAGAMLKPFHGFSLCYNFTAADSGNVSTCSASVIPAGFISLSGGYSTGCSQFAASLTLLFRHVNFSYSLSYHPYLGSTHTFGASFTTRSLPLPLQYGAVLRDADAAGEKININRATGEEIKALPGLSERSAGRLMLYREKIGRLTDKSLVQVGLSDDEIESVRLYTYGLERSGHDEDDGDENRALRTKERKNSGRKFLPRKERVKLRFRRMIKAGIPAHTAIRYSEMPESADGGGIETIVESDGTLTDEQKRAVLGICAE